jgi:mRNA interferase YafQ
MLTIKHSSAFKRDYQKTKKTPRYNKHIDSLLESILRLLLDDQPLPASCKDHSLKGEWQGYRDCHVYPDLILIYRKSGEALLLARLGSHSELF